MIRAPVRKRSTTHSDIQGFEVRLGQKSRREDQGEQSDRTTHHFWLASRWPAIYGTEKYTRGIGCRTYGIPYASRNPTGSDGSSCHALAGETRTTVKSPSRSWSVFMRSSRCCRRSVLAVYGCSSALCLESAAKC